MKLSAGRIAFRLLLALPAAVMLGRSLSASTLPMDLLHPSGEMAVRLMLLAMLPGPLAEQPIDNVKKKAFLEEWTLLKTQIQGDCYEVYARTRNGEAIEAFFHPQTMKKLVVFRRGKEIFRAKGFAG